MTQPPRILPLIESLKLYSAWVHHGIDAGMCRIKIEPEQLTHAVLLWQNGLIEDITKYLSDYVEHTLKEIPFMQLCVKKFSDFEGLTANLSFDLPPHLNPDYTKPPEPTREELVASVIESMKEFDKTYIQAPL